MTSPQVPGAELLPCPFCGGEPRLFINETNLPGYRYMRRCTDCLADGPGASTSDAALAAWNKRSPLPADPKAGALDRVLDGAERAFLAHTRPLLAEARSELAYLQKKAAAGESLARECLEFMEWLDAECERYEGPRTDIAPASAVSHALTVAMERFADIATRNSPVEDERLAPWETR